MMKSGAAILALAWFIAALPARAQLSASLTASVENSGSGQTIVFCGTLDNTGSSGGIFLNTIQFTLNGSATNSLISGSNGFYANVPGILCPGETYTGELFSISVSGSAPPADYTGSVALLGGTNIFASGSLASAGFTVLSPSVTIVATGSSAAEDGPVNGTFTISRTGGTEIGLPVSFTVGGTAVSGADYQPIATSGTIASGSSSATVTVTPIPNNVAQPNPTVTLTLDSSPPYDMGAPDSGTVTIQVKPADAWRYANFRALANTPQAADTADWSGAGIPNLIAFALDINPNDPVQSLLPSTSLLSNYLTLTYAPNPAATDVTYSVQASTDLITWSAVNVQSTGNPPLAPPGSVSYRYAYPIAAPGRAFLRLTVTRTDD